MPLMRKPEWAPPPQYSGKVPTTNIPFNEYPPLSLPHAFPSIPFQLWKASSC